jgi:hypothetical protein
MTRTHGWTCTSHSRCTHQRGGPAWSFRFGRNQVSWGNGYSGNLLLSDYSDFYDFLGLSMFGKNLKFSTFYSVFDAVDPKTLAATIYEAFIAHRLDIRLFEKLSFAVNEAVTFGNTEPELVRDLNYLMIFHNWTLPERTNSLLSVEFDYTPWRYFELYGQIAMDEFMTAYEAERDGNGGASVFAYLLGTKGSYPLGPGYLRAGLEWVMTSPWLYNRHASPYYYNVHRYYSLTTDSYEYIVKPIGYKFGPDSIVWDFFTGYAIPNGPEISGGFFYHLQGETTILTACAPLAGDEPPTGQNPERTMTFSISASCPVFPWLKAGAEVAYITKSNVDHIAGTYSNDIELSGYVTLKY